MNQIKWVNSIPKHCLDSDRTGFNRTPIHFWKQKYLKVLLSVEHDGLGLNLSVLDVDLVSSEDDRDIFADANEISVPVRDVLVGDAWRHVEHDNGTLALDVVAVTQAAKLLLAGCVPHVETKIEKSLNFCFLFLVSFWNMAIWDVETIPNIFN